MQSTWARLNCDFHKIGDRFCKIDKTRAGRHASHFGNPIPPASTSEPSGARVSTTSLPSRGWSLPTIFYFFSFPLIKHRTMSLSLSFIFSISILLWHLSSYPTESGDTVFLFLIHFPFFSLLLIWKSCCPGKIINIA